MVKPALRPAAASLRGAGHRVVRDMGAAWRCATGVPARMRKAVTAALCRLLASGAGEGEAVVPCLTEHRLPEAALAGVPFEAVWEHRPAQRGRVFNKHAPEGVPAHRYYASYGATPPKEKKARTYMFSASGEACSTGIPALFAPVLDHLNARRGAGQPAYNQLVVNWYETAEEYTPMHFDCLDGMPPGADVTVVNLIDPSPEVREDRLPYVVRPRRGKATALPSTPVLRQLVFKKRRSPKTVKRIDCAHGSCVTFGGAALTEWRHGVPKAQAFAARRVSLSFRSYVEE
eukprot:TRINITY_DN19869_c0_g1_i1.p1 TRINITY_DN19869_c0_g1~~TRINITY_DN19869_c0_g1_i1.p1  ORF type:complete len:288 (+),score=73.31 TRINITY_DN19869_c0_g1_i1:75-938(+)